MGEEARIVVDDGLSRGRRWAARTVKLRVSAFLLKNFATFSRCVWSSGSVKKVVSVALCRSHISTVISTLARLSSRRRPT